jgi:hypothetical protein
MYSVIICPIRFFLDYAATYVARKTGSEVVLRVALGESYVKYFAYLDRTAFDMVAIETATPSWDHDKDSDRTNSSAPSSARDRRYWFCRNDGTAHSGRPLIDPSSKCEYEKACARIIESARGVFEFDFLPLEEMNAATHPHFDESMAHRYWDGNRVGQRAPHAQV